MTLTTILLGFLGVMFALFIPGFVITQIWFRELKGLEIIAYSFALSLAIDILLALVLGGTEALRDFTGGITAFNMLFYLIVISVILFIIFFIKTSKK